MESGSAGSGQLKDFHCYLRIFLIRSAILITGRKSMNSPSVLLLFACARFIVALVWVPRILATVTE